MGWHYVYKGGVMTIDFVVPYVNNKDKKWQESFVKTALRYDHKQVASLHGARYEDDLDTIYYQLQLVHKNMPWINKIFLLVCSKDQIIPSLLPPNCEIVLHEQFIPFKYLPTFNSCTIEMFLWNIPNLSEHFIYANDDMLPIKPLKPSDFYYNGRIKMNFIKETLKYESSQFKHQCYFSYHCVMENNEFPKDIETYYRPQHTFTPMILSHCKECFDKNKEQILSHIRRFRKDEQCNQYIYPIYDREYYGCYHSKIKFYYTDLLENDLMENVEKSEIICVNYAKNKENVTKITCYLENLCKS